MKKKKMNAAISMSTKILVMKSEVIMQLNLIEYKDLTQTTWGRSQHNNDKMRVVFAEGIKCGKDCSLISYDIATRIYAL